MPGLFFNGFYRHTYQDRPAEFIEIHTTRDLPGEGECSGDIFRRLATSPPSAVVPNVSQLSSVGFTAVCSHNFLLELWKVAKL